MNTAELKQFLATNAEVQRMIQERYDLGEYEDNAPAEEIAHHEKVVRDAKDPKKWKRVRKYNVGSVTEMGVGDDIAHVYPHLIGGVVREFWLDGTDHVTFLLVEKDGDIKLVDDLSD